jgi:hypothetical protein
MILFTANITYQIRQESGEWKKLENLKKELIDQK